MLVEYRSRCFTKMRIMRAASISRSHTHPTERLPQNFANPGLSKPKSRPISFRSASSAFGSGTGPRWPQPSMPGPFRQVYLDVKGEQSIEQLRLAIKMMLAEPAARKFFAAVLE
jgi:hypothetical protein